MPRISETTVIPLGNYNGTRNFQGAAAPAGSTEVRIRLKRCTTATPTLWPNEATRVRIRIEESADGGATYDRATEGQFRGGIILDRSGAELAECSLGMNLRENAVLRGSITITSGPCRTEGIVEFLGAE